MNRQDIIPRRDEAALADAMVFDAKRGATRFRNVNGNGSWKELPKEKMVPPHVAKRREAILAVLQSHAALSFAQICDRVIGATMHDLYVLEAEGQIARRQKVKCANVDWSLT